MTLDPYLSEQIHAAESTGHEIQAILSVGADADAHEIAGRVVDRVRQITGQAPGVVNVLKNLGLIVVSARAEFLRHMIEQPEFESASANRTTPPPGKPAG